MTDANQTTPTALVTGASRGFGRAIAAALHAEGSPSCLPSPVRPQPARQPAGDELGDRLRPRRSGRDRPRRRRNAHDAVPARQPGPERGRRTAARGPCRQHAWETFSRTGTSTYATRSIAIREALLLPLRPGEARSSRCPSGAAVAGSPLSGGYAGASRPSRLITGYPAADVVGACRVWRPLRLGPAEADRGDRAGLGGGRAYASRNDLTVEQYLEEIRAPGIPAGGRRQGDARTHRTQPAPAASTFLLTPAGLSPLP